MQSRSFWLSREGILGLTFTLLLIVPVTVLGGTKTVYVDKNATGSEDGSSVNPYHSIGKAMENVSGGTEVRVKNGTYKEHITIPKNVDLVSDSENRDKVIIKSDNDSKPTVIMKDDTALSHITVKGGSHGVRIVENAKAHIFDAIIANNDRDGIHIDSAPLDKKNRVLIDKTLVKYNGRTGIYSEKRFIVLINSDIISNNSDGIDLALGTKAWLENNRINDNKGSGAKLVLDNASIFGKKNGFRNNKREGLEINSYRSKGTIELKKTASIGNNRYGIARVARTAFGARLFGNLSFGVGINGSRIENNALGNTSSVIRSY